MASRTKSPMDQLSAHIDRAWDRMASGDIAGALRSAEKAAEMDADSPEVQNLLGYVLAADGRAEEAIERYRQAIELDESFVEAMLNATEVLLHPLRDWDAAIAMVEQALEWIEEDAEMADALLLQVDALLGKGARDEAERVLSRVPKGPFDNAGIELALGRPISPTHTTTSASAASSARTSPVWRWRSSARATRSCVRRRLRRP
jgi:tetratricopeptide (TPR) repeat protein